MTILAAVFAGLAAWFAIRPPARLRQPPVPRSGKVEPMSPMVMRSTTLIAAGAAFIVLGGWLGVVAAVAIWLLAPTLWERITRRGDDARVVVKYVAPIADMLSAAVSAGVHVDVAVRTIADAIDEPAARAMRRVAHARSLGASAEEAWAGCPAPLEPIAQAIVRTERSGAGLVDVLHGVADDARRAHRTQVEIAARTAGVRAVAPLAACFLPAFLLVGVVPVVVSLVEGFAW